MTDNKVPQTDGTYESVVVSASDYYPFGMAMAERTFSNESYRYGFNGKENDTDFGSHIQDYGFRLYSPAEVRFLSVDPLTKGYPMLTPYQFASNTPIWGIDLDGLEVMLHTDWRNFVKKIKVIREIQIRRMTVKDGSKEHKVAIITHRFEDKQITFSLSYSPDLIHDKSIRADKNDNWLKDKWKRGGEILTKTDGVSLGDLTSIKAITYHGSKKALTFAMTGRLLSYNDVINPKSNGNSFLHFYGSALVTSIFGYDAAKTAQDIHERESVQLTEDNLLDTDNVHRQGAIMDNVKDAINNAWGRSFGMKLRKKYNIGNETMWTVDLAKNYMNDIIQYWNNSVDSQNQIAPLNESDNDFLKKWVKELNYRLQFGEIIDSNTTFDQAEIDGRK